jgi:hypothetical protein
MADRRFNETDPATVVVMMDYLQVGFPIPKEISLDEQSLQLPPKPIQQQLLPLWRNMLRRHFGLGEPWLGFESIPPIANANPLIRIPLSVHVPSRLKIVRTTDELYVVIDRDSLESTNLTADTNMVTGVEYKIYAYPEGETRPANPGQYGIGGIDFNLGNPIWSTHGRPPLKLGKRYLVELELSLFETDLPPQHMWDPHEGKAYKLLWQRTLKQTVE